MVAKTLSTSQKYASLQREAGKLAEFCQALFPLLVAHSDDFGRQAGDVFTVKHAVVPASPRKEHEVESALIALHKVGLIVWYEADGRKCIEIVDFDRHQMGLHKRTVSDFPGTSGNFREIPSEQKGTEEKGTEGEEKGTGADAPVEAFVSAWNEDTSAPIAKCREVTPARRKHIRNRLQELTLDEWRAVFRRVQASSFCRGEVPGRAWVASLDWVIGSKDTAVKVLEGKYDDRVELRKTGTDSRGVTGPSAANKYDHIEER